MYVADFVRALLLFFFYCFCHCGRLIQRGGGISTLLATQTASVVRVYEGLQRPRLAAFGLVARKKCTPASDNFLFKYCFAFFFFSGVHGIRQWTDTDIFDGFSNRITTCCF